MSAGSFSVVAIGRTDTDGLNVIPYAVVTVRDETNATVMPVYTSAAMTTQISPTICDANGKFFGYTPSGRYMFTVAGQTELIDVPGPVYSAVQGRTSSASSLTLTASDSQQLIETTNAAVTITIPTEASENLGSGFIVSGIHHGSGVLTFAGSVTIIKPAALTATAGQYAPWTLVKSRVAANTWILYGYLVAA